MGLSSARELLNGPSCPRSGPCDPEENTLMRQRGHWWHGRHARFFRIPDRREVIPDTAMGLFLLTAFAVNPGAASAAEGVALQYNRDVRPILAEYCFPCHGPDSAARKADLRLDKREA